ncbi:MAG: ribulose-phosphate 3-epimerase [Candidatus Latescibacterota bacterium]|nr:MAG: ribulose-phosphate 3-epimerase [Candidatus Latescibacterota bacterium]
MKVKVAPSILSADFSCLEREIRKVEPEADMLHLDVMDGHFVPNITFGPLVVEAVRRITPIPLMVHLMITDPSKYAEAFARAGADLLLFHLEAVPEPSGLLSQIRSLGPKPGLVLNPETSEEAAFPWLGEVDLLLVMTVHPGFGAQRLIPETLGKVARIRERILKEGLSLPIAVDGGINPETAPLAVSAGAEILVAGNAIFGTDDPLEAVRKLRGK